MEMLVTREALVEMDEDPITDLVLGDKVVACIQHTEDGHFILFEQDGDTVTMLEEFSNFYLALNVARTIYQ